MKRNNLSVLPFYKQEEETERNRYYAYGEIFPLYAPVNQLLPFQIITQGNLAQEVVLIHDGTSVDITEEMVKTGLRTIQFAELGYSVVVYPAILPMNIHMEEGRYVLKVTMNTREVFYSDVFTAVSNMEGKLKIEWYDEEDLVFNAGRIVYTEPRFKNRLYLSTEIGKPEYPFEEEGQKRDGYFFAEKQISSKTYKFVITANEALCDVMRFIRLSDYVKITDKYGNEYDVDSFLMTARWQDTGSIASVECEFTTDTIVKRIGKGYILAQKGDFNDDYFNDYLINENGNI